MHARLMSRQRDLGRSDQCCWACSAGGRDAWRCKPSPPSHFLSLVVCVLRPAHFLIRRTVSLFILCRDLGGMWTLEKRCTFITWVEGMMCWCNEVWLNTQLYCTSTALTAAVTKGMWGLRCYTHTYPICRFYCKTFYTRTKIWNTTIIGMCLRMETPYLSRLYSRRNAPLVKCADSTCTAMAFIVTV